MRCIPCKNLALVLRVGEVVGNGARHIVLISGRTPPQQLPTYHPSPPLSHKTRYHVKDTEFALRYGIVKVSAQNV